MRKVTKNTVSAFLDGQPCVVSGYMMHCGECDHVFDEDDAGSQRETERLSGRGTASWDLMTCPKCGSDNVGRADMLPTAQNDTNEGDY